MLANVRAVAWLMSVIETEGRLLGHGASRTTQLSYTEDQMVTRGRPKTESTTNLAPQSVRNMFTKPRGSPSYGFRVGFVSTTMPNEQALQCGTVGPRS